MAICNAGLSLQLETKEPWLSAGGLKGESEKNVGVAPGYTFITPSDVLLQRVLMRVSPAESDLSC